MTEYQLTPTSHILSSQKTFFLNNEKKKLISFKDECKNVKIRIRVKKILNIIRGLGHGKPFQ